MGGGGGFNAFYWYQIFALDSVNGAFANLSLYIISALYFRKNVVCEGVSCSVFDDLIDC